ncbi:MAG: hypothetical protein ACE5GX_13330 [Thermoanaerobaculia bacterium]
MPDLKPISPDALPAALEKAVRYRLLNEPMQAESICLDILEIEPSNEKALITLLLALTDQFHRRMSAVKEATELLPRLTSDYRRAYYEGIIWERRANALHDGGAPGAGHLAYDSLRQAMACYKRAIELRPAGNDEAVLRWNTCVRILTRHPEIKPVPADDFQPMLE